MEAGAKVVVADLAEDKGKALAAELGDAVVFVPTDVTKDESVDQAVTAATELGPLRTAVVVHGGPAAGRRMVGRDGIPYSADIFARTMDIFLTGTYRVMSKAAAAMTHNEPLDSGQRGVVVSTASIAGFEGLAGQSDYSAAKGGVIGLTLTAARDLAPAGCASCASPPAPSSRPPTAWPKKRHRPNGGPGCPTPSAWDTPTNTPGSPCTSPRTTISTAP